MLFRRGNRSPSTVLPAPAGARSGEYGVTTVRQSIPKEAFSNSFQKLYERCQQCVVKDGDYFEGQ
jgi:hypothetical protein